MIKRPEQLMLLRMGLPLIPANDLGGGSGSSSSSASTSNVTDTTTVQNFDKRVAVNSGVGISSDSSTITVNATSTDAATVQAALDFATTAQGTAALVQNNSLVGAIESIDRANARSTDAVTLANSHALDFAASTVAGALGVVGQSDQMTNKTLNDALGFAQTVFTAGVGLVSKASDQVTQQNQLLATAYDNAKGDGTQKTQLMYVAIGAVALIAVATQWRH